MPDLLSFVEQEIGSDRSGHDPTHAKRVLSLAKQIAAKEGGNLRLIEAAALLHDTIDSKLFSNPQGQIDKVTSFLKANGYRDEEIQAILAIITTMSWHLHNDKPVSLEAAIVTDADRLEALGAVGIIRCIEYGSVHGRPFYEEKNLKRDSSGVHFAQTSETDLSHFYDKLLKLGEHFYTPTGKKMAEQRIAFLQSFLTEFYNEVA
jgi:uncharacterized protein